MRPIFKFATALITSVALSGAAATAEETTEREPLRFSNVSTQGSSAASSSAPFWFPAWVAFGFGTIVNHDTKIFGSGGYMEPVGNSHGFNDIRVELGWSIAEAASSAASSSVFSGFTPYFVGGLIYSSQQNRTISNTFSTFQTNGNTDFQGVYVGLTADIIGSRARNAAISSSVAAILWDAFFNVGYGRADVDVFNGSFRRGDSGLFFEVGTGVYFDLGGVLFGPTLSYRHFDQSRVKLEDTIFGFKLIVPIE